MPQAKILFLWHMHQPYYYDPLTSTAAMPWVRLHCLKGYNDMIGILDEFPDVHCTFNLVPSLIMQIENYLADSVHDRFYDLTLRDPRNLDEDERLFLLKNFFSVNWDTLVRPNSRYWQLLQKRGANWTEKDYRRSAAKFNARDLFDLQVWFNLAWFGHVAVREYPEIAALKNKGADFTEDDKKVMLQAERKVMGGLLERYRKAYEEGRIEISVSPMFHPILPLLCNTDFARRGDSHVPLPLPFSYPEDARRQIADAVDFGESRLGKRPVGMWPSEGSVAPELIAPWAAAGVQWVASDQEVLARSTIAGGARADLWQPYRIEDGSQGLAIFFRDRGLSDAIGFDYAKARPGDAVGQFLGHVAKIAEAAHGDKRPPVVNVILDGENPWESYPDGGRAFLSALYGELSRNEQFGSITPSECLAKYPPQRKIESLHSGSWINANYNIWIGHPEENAAWEILRSTRECFAECAATVDEQRLDRARQELFAAEGSDWFWWYGDDFITSFAAEFDALFRTHCANVYRLLGREVPEKLRQPLLIPRVQEKIQLPRNFITPRIDGRLSKYYDWLGSGRYEIEGGGSMHRQEKFFESLRFGFDLDNFYLLLSPDPSHPSLAGLGIAIYFLNNNEHLIYFNYRKDVDRFELLLHREGTFKTVDFFDTVAVGKVVELAVPFKVLGVEATEKVQFCVSVRRDTLELDRYPRLGYIHFEVPDENFELVNWSV